VGSYPTLSPLPAEAGGLLSVALSLRSPSPDVIRHRVSVEPGLSSPYRLSTLVERGCPANWQGSLNGERRGMPTKYRPPLAEIRFEIRCVALPVDSTFEQQLGSEPPDLVRALGSRAATARQHADP